MALDCAAASKKDIDAKVDTALERFYKEVAGGSEVAKSAKGVLVFPNVVKAGFGIGGEYGAGALRVGGETVDYYSTTAASVGLQIGAESKTIVLCFMNDEVLASFRKSNGFEIGVDGSVALSRRGCRRRDRHDHGTRAGRRLRVRPHGSHGQHQPRGNQDLEDRARLTAA